ncbi:transcriptional regulator, AraC family [Rhizobium sp. CF080]|uniref:helix-turn-helix domain-containing protein n=1 Tax=Rhizobium sp. (strain CF080) TaxID=1144310 RepID=UPI0002716FBD|nr:helix-turn-helix domain-containing protein [Rhizobium sp. CF080]EUB98166.1 transcriptional regulator, AraC family [Rhizobium sp. CF080]
MHILRNGPAHLPGCDSAFVAERMLNTVDTNSVSPGSRLSYWRRHVDVTNGLNIVCSTENFLGRMENRVLGSCSIHGVRISTPHRAIRTRTQQDLVFANIQLCNDGARFSGNREFAMNRGSLLLYEASEAYQLDFDGESDSLVLAMPKSELQKRVADLPVHLGEAFEYDSHKVAMLAQMMRGVLEMPTQVRQSVTDSIAESVINMLVATLYDCEAASNRTPTYGTAAMLQRIKAYVNSNIADPDLSPVVVADAVGITVSYLHKIFLLNNTTLMQAILAERLERCRKDIAKLDRAGGISQVAYAWGFNDASHFSRSFRKRFRVSPREYRMQIEQRDATWRKKRD